MHQRLFGRLFPDIINDYRSEKPYIKHFSQIIIPATVKYRLDVEQIWPLATCSFYLTLLFINIES